MATLTGVFESILTDGFEGSREPIEVCFDADAGAQITSWSVRVVDGLQRILSCVGIVHYALELVSEAVVVRAMSCCSESPNLGIPSVRAFESQLDILVVLLGPIIRSLCTKKS